MACARGLLTAPLLAMLLCSCHGLPYISPPSPGPATPIPPVEDSHVAVPVMANLAGLQATANGMIPGTISEDDGHDCTEYGVYKGGDLSLNAQGSAMTTTAPIVYRVKGYAVNTKPVCLGEGSCGYDEPARRANVILQSSLSWSSDWRITSSSHADIAPLDSCKITIAGFDVTGKIMDAVRPRLDPIAAVVDQKVPELTYFKPQAQKAWDALQQPIKLADNVWLLVNPSIVQASALNGAGLNETVSVALTSRPTIIVSTETPPATTVPLPPLNVGAAALGFHVAVAGSADFNAATTIAQQRLVGREYPLPANHTVKIDDVRIYGLGSEAILQLKISGSISGTVYFVGTPTYASQTPQGDHDVLSVPDLDYSLETKNVLAKAADWLLHEDFVKSIRATAVYPLDKKLSDLRSQLSAGLNRTLASGVEMSGSVDDLRIAGLYATSSDFQVQAVADGQVAVAIAALPNARTGVTIERVRSWRAPKNTPFPHGHHKP